MPVLFDYGMLYDTNGQPIAEGYLAMSANVVNCLVTSTGPVYYSDTGCAAFRDYIAGVVTNAQPLDVWDEYHCKMGEIHCGTATRRSLATQTPWWQLVNKWE